jgi:mono/diheme cytochrome c family protein
MKKTAYIFCTLLVIVIGLNSCTENPNSPGLEYMPDMYRSPAVEAYVDYGMDPYLVGYDVAEGQRMTPSARKPVPGTVQYLGEDKMAFAMPYPLTDPLGDYERAGLEIFSPIETTDANTAAGKEIYGRMCIHCHGEAGKGDGSLSKKIDGIPDYTGALKDLPEGQIYHALMHGKGVMGSHASQLNAEERWLVVQYVQFLQRGGKAPEAGTAATAVVDAAPQP